MLFTTELVTAYPLLTTVLALLLVGGLLASAAAWHNHRLRTTKGPIEYEVVIGVLYTLVGAGLIYWPAALVAGAAFVLTGGLMLWGARLRADERGQDSFEATVDSLAKRTGPNA